MHELTLIGSNRVTWCEALTWLPAFFLLLTQRQMESLMSPHPLNKFEGGPLKLQLQTAQKYPVLGWNCPRTKCSRSLLQFFWFSVCGETERLGKTGVCNKAIKLHGRKRNGNTGVYKEKSTNTDNYTSLHLFSKAVWDWQPKLDLRQHQKWGCGSDVV